MGGPGRDFWVFGEDFPNSTTRGKPDEYELGAWRVEVSPARPAAEDLFLNVMQVMNGDAGRSGNRGGWNTLFPGSRRQIRIAPLIP